MLAFKVVLGLMVTTLLFIDTMFVSSTAIVSTVVLFASLITRYCPAWANTGSLKVRTILSFVPIVVDPSVGEYVLTVGAVVSPAAADVKLRVVALLMPAYALPAASVNTPDAI